MDRIVRLLTREQFGDAIDGQGDLVVMLKSLLELLQSEDRRSDIEKEKARLKKILKELGKIIPRQKDLRVATERGGKAERLTPAQQKVIEKTGDLLKTIRDQDAIRQGESEPDESQTGEPKPGDDSPKEGKPSKGKPSEGKPSEGKPSEGKPSEGKPSEGEPSKDKSKSQDSSEKQRTPGRDEIEEAREEMQRAIKELKKNAHDDASGHQDEAIVKLEQAKEKLEEILRQLREEERELLLAALEARFQKMLVMQLTVYNGTVGLHKISKEKWNNRHFGRSRELARQEDDIAVEATRALTLLQEEGSSVAFPEAVGQLRDDMRSVARLLERNEVAELTQGIERDIIEALEELIEALQKEMESKKKKNAQQQQQAQQSQEDQALVDQLGELKMLRTLQMRINRRTKRLGRLIDGDQAEDSEVVDQLQILSRRQSRVQEATYDVATGKNR